MSTAMVLGGKPERLAYRRAANAHGPKLLLRAVRDGESEIAAKLILLGSADVNSQDGYQNSALHYAAWAGHRPTLAAIVTAGAALNNRNHVGNTALHLAVENGQLGATRDLLAAGALPLPNSLGQAPYDLALLLGSSPEMVELLRP